MLDMEPVSTYRNSIFISTDSHVTEPIDLYGERVDRAFRDRVPRIEVVGDWRSLLIEGLRPRKLMPASEREFAIVGDWDRNLYVFDAVNGKILYQTRLPTSVQGFPITYAVRGKQYLAIPVGTGGGSWGAQVPVQLTPDKQRRDNANAIYVFALPNR